MKKLILLITALFAFAALAEAVPAYPGPIKIVQPDGTQKIIYLQGDEYLHWAVDQNGRPVRVNAEGWVRDEAITRASLDYNRYVAREARRKDSPARFMSPMSSGNNRFLVFLIEFSDVTFKVNNPKEAFSNLLNQRGYSANNGTGSVRDYYYDQSTGQFDPVFDVLGPFKVSGKMADYGGNDDNGSDTDPGAALKQACALAHAQGLNFSDYDLNGDGYVDNIYFFYAGYSEAEGGGEDTIWPHASALYGKNATSYDGVQVGRYACSSEFKGTSGERMGGIGTFCHEFGHVLGLPDFYDTDYKENGSSDGLLDFSLMSGGPYNNGGNTPPNLNAIERNLLGWMGAPTKLTDNCSITIPAITNNVAYITQTSTDGEYFLYEVRDGSGWDAHIRRKSGQSAPKGLLMYHIDQSARLVEGKTAAQRWRNWDGINDYASHPCFRIVYAERSFDSYQDVVFPGSKNITQINEAGGHTKTWDGGFSGYDFSNISYSNGSVSLTLTKNKERRIFGKVIDSAGEPLAGVIVSVGDKNASSSGVMKMHFAPGKLRSERQVRLAAAIGTATTDNKGNYSINIPASASSELEIEFFKSRYQPKTADIALDAGSTCRDVFLLNAVEGGSSDLQKYKTAGSYGLGYGEEPASVTVGVQFTAAELTKYVGMKITSIDFTFFGKSADAVYVFIDFGETRHYTKKVDNPNFQYKMSSQNISGAGITIPENTDMIFGYALKNVDYKYPVTLADDDGVAGGGVIRNGCEEKGGGWEALETSEASYNAVISMKLQMEISPFTAFGVKIISNPGSYTAGSTYNFGFENALSGEKPTKTTWYFDGAEQSEKSITLPAGKHEVKAVCSYSDGRTEEIIQIIMVE